MLPGLFGVLRSKLDLLMPKIETSGPTCSREDLAKGSGFPSSIKFLKYEKFFYVSVEVGILR